MRKKLIIIVVFGTILSLVLAACGSQSTNVPAEVPTEAIDLEVPATEGELGAEEPAQAEATATTEPVQAEPTIAAVPTVTPAGESQAVGGPSASMGQTLSTVQSRGTLICAVNGQLPGFSFLAPDGNYQGFDVDFCRAVAAAVLGDAEAVEFRPTNTQERFTVLQTGEVDLLVRNTTWSLTRDTELGLDFTTTTFYDGQGLMVPADSGIASVQDLEGGTICVQRGTTTEQNLADVMASEGIEYTPAVFDDINATYGAYAEGRCDAVTSDKSQLSSVAKGVLPDPDNHIILDVTLSKEPLGPAVRHGDDQWYDIVQWVVLATIAAEEYGITSENVADLAQTSEKPEVRRLLGAEGELGTKLGLSNDWVVNVIGAVGNYGEIYDRNLGEGTETFIPRGINNLYNQDGLHYSPPFN